MAGLAERRAKRQARLEKKAEELGITVAEFKKQKREKRKARLAAEAKKAGLSVKEYKKKRKADRIAKRQKEQEEKQRAREERRKNGPVKYDFEDIDIPAHEPIKKSDDPVGDFIKRHKDKGLDYIRILVTGKWGSGSNKGKQIMERAEKELADSANSKPSKGEKTKKAKATTSKKKTTPKKAPAKKKTATKKASTKKKKGVVRKSKK